MTSPPGGGPGEYGLVFKIILVGDATVGKTHLLSRYTRGTLPKAPQATIGVEFATQLVKLEDGATVKAQLWDTAGQEKYRAITGAHYRRAVGALLVYDITRKVSFINAAKWLEELRQQAEPDIIVMLVGNKLDLVENDPSTREIPYELAAQYAQKNGLLFYEASAVSTTNVKKSFESLLQELYNHKSKTGQLGAMGESSEGGPGVGPGGQRKAFVDLYNSELQGGIKLGNTIDTKEPGCCGQT